MDLRVDNNLGNIGYYKITHGHSRIIANELNNINNKQY